MRTVKQWLFILLLAWTHSVSTYPAPLNTSTPSDSLANGIIPRAFHFLRDYELPIHYAEEAFFINTVQALNRIAPGDFMGEMPTGAFTTTRYPQPAIRVNSPHSPSIPRQYVVWGLYLSFLTMCHDSTGFTLSHFTLFWNAREVGGIGFGGLQSVSDASHHLQADGSTASIIQVTDEMNITEGTLAMTTTTTNNNVTDLSNRRVTIECTYLAKNIPKIDLSIAVVWFLTMVAYTPAYTIIRGRYIAPASDGGVRFSVQALERTAPPFLTYAAVIETLSAAADFLVFHGLYQGLEMVIKVGGTAVGKAVLTQPW
ncbi:MAG: hypothetical protein Q9220_002402 [cf. Caloplaca sp. 1 TL-2023]